MSDTSLTTLRVFVGMLRSSGGGIAVLTMLCAVCAFAFSRAQTPEFLAEAQLSFQQEGQSNADAGLAAVEAQTAAQLAARGAASVLSDEVLQRAKTSLRTPMGVAELGKLLTTKIDQSSNLVTVQARSTDKRFAALLANTVARGAADIQTQTQRKRFAQGADRVEQQLRRLRRQEKGDTTDLTLSFYQQIASLRTLSVTATPALLTQPASVPDVQGFPMLARNTLFGGIIGLLFGVVFAFVRSSFDCRLRDTEEIQKELDLPVVGSVREDALGHAAYIENGRGPMLDQDLESFRILRSNIELLDVDHPLRSIVVTSALPQEGKSTVASSLALALSAAGKRALLVECNLRQPCLAALLGIEAGPGLSDYLCGKHKLPDVVQFVQRPEVNAAVRNGKSERSAGAPAERLAVVTAGSRLIGPELLSSQRFRRFLNEAVKTYEVVVVDTPPLLSVAETLEIIPLAEQLLLCIRAEQTTRDQAQAVSRVLARLSGGTIGVVVTGIKRNRESDHRNDSHTTIGRRPSLLLKAPAITLGRCDVRNALLILLTAVLVGVGVSAGTGGLLLISIVGAAFIGLGVQDWRRSVLGLLVFLPYSGVLIIAAYPATGPATLVKDFLFVIPAYLGFAHVFLLRLPNKRMVGFPLGIVLVFALLVVLQLLNPTLPNVVVGLIGTKVWLMYIPMALLGYHLVRTKADLRLVLFLMCAAAVLPLCIGIIEGILINTPHANIVYGWYGNAASAVTQDFANVGGATATINRVPSTFSFVAQYYLFTMSMVAIIYGYWRGFLAYSQRKAGIGALLFMLVVFAAVLSGARGALLAVPAMIFMMLLFDGVSIRLMLWLPVVAVAALSVAALVFGTSLAALLSNVWDHGAAELAVNTVKGFHQALSQTLVGLGPGVDTVAARYGLPTFNPYGMIGGSLKESWWVKLVLELGLAGLAVGVAMLGTIFIRAFTVHRRLSDPQLRSVSAGIVTLIAFVLVSNFKASYLDLDPTNVYFWLLVGVLLKFPALDAANPRPAGLPYGKSSRSVKSMPSNVPARLRSSAVGRTTLPGLPRSMNSARLPAITSQNRSRPSARRSP